MRCVDVGCRHGAGAVEPVPSPSQLARFSVPARPIFRPRRLLFGTRPSRPEWCAARVAAHGVQGDNGRAGSTRHFYKNHVGHNYPVYNFVLRLVSGYLLILNGKWIKSGPKKTS